MVRNKILFVATISGTIKRFLFPFADRLKEEGWSVHAMAGGISTESSFDDHFDRTWDINFSRKPASAIASIAATIYRIKKILEQEKYTIVHTHTPIASFVTRLATGMISKKDRPKIVYTAHGFHFHQLGHKLSNFLFLQAERIGARWTDILIVINEDDYRSALGKGLVEQNRVRLLPGIGVDTSCFDPDVYSDSQVQEQKRKCGIPQRARVFLMPAEFNKGKRHIDAIKAMRLLPENDACLAFAGRGRLEEELKEIVTKQGLNEKVLFLGYQEQIPLLLKMSSALILPSVREGLPRVVLEALCMNVVTIATDVRGNRDLLKEGHGILVPPRAPCKLAAAMQKVLDNNAEVEAMASAGRQLVLDRFSQDIVVSRQLEIYRELV
jgi:glycosyltransferase involved in cell wall biosynthesis